MNKDADSRPSHPEFEAQAVLKDIDRGRLPLDTLPRVRQVLLGADPEGILQPEQNYSQIVFGHSLQDFDLDQFITYFLAVKSGLVSLDAPIEFKASVDRENLDQESALVIEGFSHEIESGRRQLTAAHRRGNFTNDPYSNEPAAERFFQYHSRSFGKNLPFRDKLFDLRYWINDQENETVDRQLRNRISTLQPQALDSFIPIFYALKHKFMESEDDVRLLLYEAAMALEKIFDIEQGQPDWQQRLASVSDDYQQELSEYQPILERNRALIQERLDDPEAFQTVTTMEGVTLTYFDIRGLQVDKGAMSAALSRGNPDLVVLVDDHQDPTNTEQVLGSSIKIRLGNTQDSSVNLLRLLAPRLNHAEALYGKGFVYVDQSSFGGHPGIIGTPQKEGSGQDPRQIWAALQEFFDHQRFTQEQFKDQAQQLAARAGVENYMIQPLQAPFSPYELSQYQVVLNLNLAEKGEQGEQIRIGEKDLEYWLQAFGDSVDENRQLLSQKTALSDPEKIVELRHKKVLSHLEAYLAANQTDRLLAVLEELNPTGLRSLNPELHLAILRAIAQDNDAIDAVWNKDNLRFRILDERLPEQVKFWMENYKLNRYKLRSLASLVDQDLVKLSRDYVLASQDPQMLAEYGQLMLAILTSDSYRGSHQDAAYDSLLEQTLFYLNQVFSIQSDLARELLSDLLEGYGDMSRHWQNIDAAYIQPLIDAFPDLTQPITEAIDQSKAQESIPGLAGSVVQAPDYTEIKRQFEQGTRFSETITLLVEITRPIKAEVEQRDFLTLDGELVKVEAEGYIHSDALRLDPENQEHLKIVAVIEEMIGELLPILRDHPQAKVRIIQGGFFNRLSRQMQSAIETKIFEWVMEQEESSTIVELQQVLSQAEALKAQLIWSDYDRSKLRYQDAPFVEK